MTLEPYRDIIAKIDRVHPQTITGMVVDAYAFETELGPLSMADASAIMAAGNPVDQKIGALMLRDEITAFVAYLRAVERRQDLTRRIITEITDGPQGQP